MTNEQRSEIYSKCADSLTLARDDLRQLHRDPASTAERLLLARILEQLALMLSDIHEVAA